jgi:hypothetical protein
VNLRFMPVIPTIREKEVGGPQCEAGWGKEVKTRYLKNN